MNFNGSLFKPPRKLSMDKWVENGGFHFLCMAWSLFSYVSKCSPRLRYLTHRGRVTHICVSKLSHHRFWWLVACSAPNHVWIIIISSLLGSMGTKFNEFLHVKIPFAKYMVILSRNHCIHIFKKVKHELNVWATTHITISIGLGFY